jgi:hypothetical protein
MSHSKSIRTSKLQQEGVRFLNPNPSERNWVQYIPEVFPDILRSPAVPYRSDRDDSRLRSNRYIAFARPYRCHQGYLIIGPEQRPILVDETQPSRYQVLPMRLDRESITSTWIFSISIYTGEGLIQIEDCCVANGEQIRSIKPYSERVKLMHRFATHIWFQDKRFQLEWDIRIAQFYSLGDIQQVIQTINGGNLCLMPELPNFRLLKVIPQKEVYSETSTDLKVGIQCLICIPIEGKPDVYDLKSDAGEDLGRASVQTLSLSKILQQKVATDKQWRVMAEWNPDFESFTIISVI